MTFDQWLNWPQSVGLDGVRRAASNRISNFVVDII
jgi:hypothetical protein